MTESGSIKQAIAPAAAGGQAQNDLASGHVRAAPAAAAVGRRARMCPIAHSVVELLREHDGTIRIMNPLQPRSEVPHARPGDN